MNKQRHEILYTLSSILIESVSVDAAIPKILRTIGEGLKWDLGEFWMVDPKDNVLYRHAAVWRHPSKSLSLFNETGREKTFPKGIGLPGLIWKTREPYWVPETVFDKDFSRSKIAAQEGLHGAIGFPVLSEDEVMGVFIFFHHNIPLPDKDLLRLLTSVGIHTGQFIKRIQVEYSLKQKIRFEETISRISYKFVALSSYDALVPESLEELGRLTGVGRVCLVLFDANSGVVDNVYEWCNEGITSEKQRFRDVSFSAFSWWMKHLRAGNAIHIPQVNHMPKEAAAEQEFLMKWNVKSLLSLPVFADKNLIGFVDLENILSNCSCKEQEITLLRIVSEILGNAIARKQSEERIQHMAYHDALTGLPNRNLFYDRMEMAILYAKRSNKMAAVMALDLDGFKSVNDSFGHYTGDLLLKAASGRMKECVRECDTVARFGGDEFMILLTNINHRDDANHVTEKLLGSLSQPFLLDNNKIIITASIGISIYPADGNDVEDLIKKADNALYWSKKEGKNTYR